MRISVFGSSYVGLATGACLAEVGNGVVCVDIHIRKIYRPIGSVHSHFQIEPR